MTAGLGVVEDGFRAEINLIDVPATGLSLDKTSSYGRRVRSGSTCRFHASMHYSIDQIESYREAAAKVDRPARLEDRRVSAALFFINGLTSRGSASPRCACC